MQYLVQQIYASKEIHIQDTDPKQVKEVLRRYNEALPTNDIQCKEYEDKLKQLD